MKKCIFVLVLALTGCGGVANTFEVESHDAVSAELRLCGKATGLLRTGSWFTAIRVIDCEGEGRIEVRFPNHRIVNCTIGYVTPGMPQRFRFKVNADGCAPILT